jgi:hypothetical protein
MANVMNAKHLQMMEDEDVQRKDVQRKDVQRKDVQRKEVQRKRTTNYFLTKSG